MPTLSPRGHQGRRRQPLALVGPQPRELHTAVRMQRQEQIVELLQRVPVAYAHVGEAEATETLVEQSLIWLVERARCLVEEGDERLLQQGLAAAAKPKPTVRARDERTRSCKLSQEGASSGKTRIKAAVFSTRVSSVLFCRGTLFGKVVVHSYRGPVESITVGASSIGKDIGLQVAEISCVIRYRRF